MALSVDPITYKAGGTDSGTPLGEWSERGAPMGIAEEIENGVPEVEPTSDLTIDELTVS